MTIPSFILVFIAAFLVALAGLYFVHLAHKKNHLSRQSRKELLQRIEALPLPRMLQSLGISFTRFFYSVPYENIHETVQLCESCTSIYLCNNRLANAEVKLSELSFCPVKKHFSPFSRNHNQL